MCYVNLDFAPNFVQELNLHALFGSDVFYECVMLCDGGDEW